MAVSKQELRIQLKAQGIKATKAQLNSLHTSVNKTGAAMGGMAGQMAIATVGFYAAARAIGSVISTGKEFKQAMANVKAISGATGAEFIALEANAKRLGATTVHTASDVAALQTEFAKLGFTASEITQVTASTLALSTAVGADLATSAATAGTTLRGFGLDVSETSRVTDVMALSFSSSALDMAKFTDSMKYVAPIAKATGVDLEGTTAILGKLANAGISGSMAGTSLRKILLEAGNAGSKLAKRMGGPISSFEDFQEKLATLKEEGFDVLSEGADLVGKRAITAFDIMLNGTETTNELGIALNSAAGEAQKMADIQLDTFEGSVKLAKSAMDGLKITIFEMNEGALRDMVDLFTEFINSIDEEELASLALSIKILAGAYGLYRAQLIYASIANKTFAVSLTSTGIGAIIVALGLAIAAIIDYTDVLAVEASEEEIAAERALKLAEAQIAQKEAVAELAGEYRSLEIEEVYKEQEKLTEALDKAGMEMVNLIVSIADEEKALTSNMSKTNDYAKLRTSIAEDKGLQEGLQEEIDALGLDFLAIKKVTEEYENNQRVKAEAAQDAIDRAAEAVEEGRLKSEASALKAHQKVLEDFHLANTDSLITNIEAKRQVREAAAIATIENEVLLAATLKEINDYAAEAQTALDEAKATKLEEWHTKEFGSIEAQNELKLTQEIAKYEALALAAETGETEVAETIKKIKAKYAKSSSDTQKKVDAAERKAKFDQSAALANAVAGLVGEFKHGAIAAGRLQQTAAVINMWSGATAALAPPPVGAGPIWGPVLAGTVIATGLMNIAQIGKSIGDFAEGGLIEGPSHSGGGVNINAEGGEFVMKRDAVDAIGVETMNAINEGDGGGSVNISFEGNVMSEDFIIDEAIPIIEEAIRRGSSIGIG